MSNLKDGNCPGNGKWTEWFDSDDPDDQGDFELLFFMRKTNEYLQKCTPHGIEGRVKSNPTARYTTQNINIGVNKIGTNKDTGRVATIFVGHLLFFFYSHQSC